MAKNEDGETESPLSQSLSFWTYHHYIHAFSLRTVQKQNLRYSFNDTADTTEKDKLYL